MYLLHIFSTSGYIICINQNQYVFSFVCDQQVVNNILNSTGDKVEPCTKSLSVLMSSDLYFNLKFSSMFLTIRIIFNWCWSFLSLLRVYLVGLYHKLFLNQRKHKQFVFFILCNFVDCILSLNLRRSSMLLTVDLFLMKPLCWVLKSYDLWLYWFHL